MTSLALAWLLLHHPASAQTCAPATPGEPMRVYLLTMSPGQALFARFGHSVLWVSGGPLRRGLAYSWGAYDSSKEEPVAAFLAGTMHYRLDVSTVEPVLERAQRAQRIAVAQRIDLPPQAIARLAPLLSEAGQPENRAYPYHWRDQNCATKVRDLLDLSLDGQLRASLTGPTGRTWRGEVLRHLAVHPLAWFGWNFMAAGEADRPVDRWGGLFLPDRLREGLDAARIDGRPLVAETCVLRSGASGWAPEAQSRGWFWTSPVGAAWAAGIGGLRARLGGALVALLGIVAGGLGLATAFLAGTTAIDGIGWNLNWFAASPLTLALGPAGVAYAFGRGRRAIASLSALLAALGVVGVGVAVVGVQDTAAISALFLPPLLATAWATRRRPAGPA